MGCGASKRSSVVPADDHDRDHDQVRKKAHPAPEVLPLHGDEPPAEMLKDGAPPPTRGALAQPVAFEVPVHEESLVRKHPPRRLLRLEDQPQVVPLTHSLLDERQEEAEQRRLQILSQRVQSAKQRVPRRNFLDLDGTSPLSVDDAMGSVNRENSSVEL